MLTEAEKERLLEIAEDLIRLKSDSGPGYEKAVGDYIYNFYRELGIAVQKQPCGGFRENITARIPGKDGKPTVIYLGHIDTVPAGDEKLWEGNPFIPQIREGKLYGRGSCDMKGSVACAMYAAEYLTKHGIKPESGLHFVYDVDEENTNIGLKEYLKSPQEADLAIVGEPTGLRLSMGHRGVMAFTVTIYGKSCHAGRADLGKNAIYAAADVIREVRNLEERISAAAQEYVGSPSIHVTYISGGSKVNVIPDKAVLWIDRRLIFGETRESCEREMTGILEKVREEWGCGFSLEVTTYCPPGKADREHPLFCGISNLLKSQGIDSTPKAFEASCEAGMLQEATGIPALIWGPGEIGQAHQADEYIELEQLYKGAELYIKFFTMEDCYV